MDSQPNETTPSEHQLWTPEILEKRPVLCVEIGLGTFVTPMHFDRNKATPSLLQTRVIGFEPDPRALIFGSPQSLQQYQDWLRVVPHPIKDHRLVAPDLAGNVNRVWMHNVISAPGVFDDFETQILEPVLEILQQDGEMIILDSLAANQSIRERLKKFCENQGLTCTPIDLRSDPDPYVNIYKGLDIIDDDYIAVRIKRKSANVQGTN